jgi:membrane-anchored protein YejM (alkaline phosphatase superfamily)
MCVRLFLGELVFGQWHLMRKNLENPVRKRRLTAWFISLLISAAAHLFYFTAHAHFYSPCSNFSALKYRVAQ